MPNTRSEIALPLRSRGRMLGALNAHSTLEMAFSQDDVTAMQMLADQVAVSIDNARLFTQTEAALNEVQVAHRRYLAESWRDFLSTRPVAKIDYARPGTRHGGDNRFLRNARRAAMVHGRTVATSSAMENDKEVAAGAFANPETALVVPLKLRGQIIGTMTLHEPDEQRAWTAQEVTLAETVVEQVALTIENLRLMDETQRRAAQEHTISAIADRLQRAPDIETLMQVTAEELNRALGGSRAYVRLSTVPQLSLDGNGHGDEGDIE
jgi:GAF domain-containing protein